jgi:VIT1/CCC1 family predicted Fe2+/Mn2+ transporter
MVRRHQDAPGDDAGEPAPKPAIWRIAGPDAARSRTRTELPTAHPELHHRDVQGGAARAAVFGVSDGLVSNMGLILGVAGADPQPSLVRLAGLAGLVAGAISMAAGEYNSMRVQAELLERELRVEARELRRRPKRETDELAQIYEQRGLDPTQAREVAEAMMSDPEVALETHAREELGIDPTQLGSPLGAAVSSFVSFSIGALLPLLPWFFAEGTVAIVASVVLGLVAAVVVGALIARSTDRPVLRGVTRQVLFTAVPAALTFAIGNALGVTV